MTAILVVSNIEGKGRGVLTYNPIKQGEVIENCPLFFTFDGFEALGDKQGLSQYEFSWPDGKVAICGGYSHLYNHSDDPNVEFMRHAAGNVADGIYVIALRDIVAGEELTHKYLCPVWW